MLISNTYDVIETIRLSLAFDDGSFKRDDITVGDYVDIVYNKNAMRRHIEGKVTKVSADKNDCICHKTNWYIVVDGVCCGNHTTDKVYVDKILDFNVTSHGGNTDVIVSPLGEHNVGAFRIVGNILQLSTNHGKTWLKVVELPDLNVTADTDEDRELLKRIEAILPKKLRPDRAASLEIRILKLIKEIKAEIANQTNSNPQNDGTIEDVNASDIIDDSSDEHNDDNAIVGAAIKQLLGL